MRSEGDRPATAAAGDAAASRWRTPGAQVLALTAALALFVAVAQASWVAIGPPVPRATSAVLLTVVALLFVLTEKFTVVFPVRRGAHAISLSEIPLVLALLMIHPALLVPVRLVGALVGLSVLRRQRGGKLAFNTALYLTQVTVAGAVFHLFGGASDPFGPAGWVAAPHR